MRLSDPNAIRALAHPVRLDLLELLTTGGPVTAAQCGRSLGIPQANASFHLRQLAKYGFVEDAGQGRDRRERLWQVVESQPRFRIDAGEDGVAQRELQRVVVEREAQAILDFAGRQDGESQAWREKAGLMTAVAVLSADDAAELRRRWAELLEPYIAGNARTPAPGERRVRYFMAATPLSALIPEDERDASDD